MAQTWGDFDGIINVDELTERVRHAAQDLQGFAQLCNPPSGKALGKNKGDTVVYVYYPNIGVAGGELDENEEMPSANITPIRGSMVIAEYGNSVRFTGKLQDLARIGPEDDLIVALINDLMKLENSEAYDEFNETQWLVAFNSTADAIVTNGTLATASNEGLTFANLRYLVAQAEKRLIPFFDGECYAVLTGVDSADTLVYDSDVRNYVQFAQGPEALNGEIAKIGKARILRDTQKIVKVGGSSSGAGLLLDETFLVGADAVQKEVALAPEIRMEDRDYGRSFGIAYYFMGRWKKILGQALHSREHVIKVDSQ